MNICLVKEIYKTIEYNIDNKSYISAVYTPAFDYPLERTIEVKSGKIYNISSIYMREYILELVKKDPQIADSLTSYYDLIFNNVNKEVLPLSSMVEDFYFRSRCCTNVQPLIFTEIEFCTNVFKYKDSIISREAAFEIWCQKQGQSK